MGEPERTSAAVEGRAEERRARKSLQARLAHVELKWEEIAVLGPQDKRAGVDDSQTAPSYRHATLLLLPAACVCGPRSVDCRCLPRVSFTSQLDAAGGGSERCPRRGLLVSVSWVA